MAGQHDGVAGNARALADCGRHQRGLVHALGIVGLRIDAGERADNCALADGDSAAIVQQRSWRIVAPSSMVRL